MASCGDTGNNGRHSGTPANTVIGKYAPEREEGASHSSGVADLPAPQMHSDKQRGRHKISADSISQIHINIF